MEGTSVPRNEPSPRQRGKAVLPLPESRQPRKRASAGATEGSEAAHAVLVAVRRGKERGRWQGCQRGE